MNLFYWMLVLHPFACFGAVNFYSTMPHPVKLTFKNVESRIAGGSTVPITQHPYQGFLAEVRSGVAYVICGCSLIAPEWAVSAAQCIAGSSSSMFVVVFGSNDLLGHDPNVNDSDSQLAFVQAGYIHGSYVNPFNGNDMSLLKLASPIDISTSTVSPISLPCAGDTLKKIDESSCFISGWGYVDQSEQLSRYLQSASVKTTTNSFCAQKYLYNTINPTTIRSSQICTGSSSGVGPCGGDGGGPLACRSSSDKSWVLIGVASFGPATCGSNQLPSVFTRISSYVTIINNTVSSAAPSTLSTLTFQDCTGGSTGVISHADNRFTIWLSASLAVLIGLHKFL